jgi:hypothetical protein
VTGRLSGIALLCGLTALFALPRSASAQTVAANIPMLVTYPTFFSGKQIVVRGEAVAEKTLWRLRAVPPDASILLVARNTRPPEGKVEVRGQFWDVGRLTQDDPRLTGLDVPAISPGGWPKPGELLVLFMTSFTEWTTAPAPAIRSIVLEPTRYVDQRVTISGQFRGRNLFGDLPQAPGNNRWQFVLRSGDASLWVTGMRPRGRGFDLDVDSRIDSNFWVEATGVVKERQGLIWIEATQLARGRAMQTTVEKEPAPPPRAPAPPPVVAFSLPTEDDTDVPPNIVVRVQFSRGVDPASVKDRVRATYLGAAPVEGGGPPPIPLTTSYDIGTRVLEVKFTKPLERFRTVKLELLEGIAAPDKAPVAPWTLTFTTGG